MLLEIFAPFRNVSYRVLESGAILLKYFPSIPSL